MSPLWRERVTLVLRPDRVILQRHKRAVGGRPVDQVALPATPRTGSLPWTAAMEGVAEMLSRPEWQRTEAKVVLSNHFVRYLVVEWVDQLSNETEHLAYAQQCFGQVYGPRAKEWVVRMNLETPGAPHLATSVDQALLGQLDEIAARNHIRLVSVKPFLIEGFNNWCERFTQAVQWFVMVEKGALCAALLGRKRWIAVRGARVGVDWQSALESLLRREQHLTDEASSAKTVFLCAPDTTNVKSLGDAWSVCPLEPSIRDAPFYGEGSLSGIETRSVPCVP